MAFMESSYSKEAASRSREKLIEDHATLSEVRYVISNYMKIIADKVSEISTKMNEGSMTKEDIISLENIGSYRLLHSPLPTIIRYRISNATSITLDGKSYYLMETSMYISGVNIEERIFSTVMIMDVNEFARIKLISSDDDITNIDSNLL